MRLFLRSNETKTPLLSHRWLSSAAASVRGCARDDAYLGGAQAEERCSAAAGYIAGSAERCAALWSRNTDFVAGCTYSRRRLSDFVLVKLQPGCFMRRAQFFFIFEAYIYSFLLPFFFRSPRE